MLSLSLVFFIILAQLFIAEGFRCSGRATSIFTMKRLQMSDIDASPPSVIPEGNATPKSKGFGKVTPKAQKEDEKDEGTKVYERQSSRGVPEYNIFLRPQNGTDTEWIPVGSMTIPRDTKVAKAVYEVEEELLKGTFKLYPKLKLYAELRKEQPEVFEYGYVLKAYPDEPITVMKKTDAFPQQGNFVMNWLGRLTNPLDSSDLKNPGEMTLNQKK